MGRSDGYTRYTDTGSLVSQTNYLKALIKSKQLENCVDSKIIKMGVGLSANSFLTIKQLRVI